MDDLHAVPGRALSKAVLIYCIGDAITDVNIVDSQAGTEGLRFIRHVHRHEVVLLAASRNDRNSPMV